MPKIKVFKGADGQWYWHIKARNGRVIATGGEGYTRVQDAHRAVRTVRRAFLAQYDA